MHENMYVTAPPLLALLAPRLLLAPLCEWVQKCSFRKDLQISTYAVARVARLADDPSNKVTERGERLDALQDKTGESGARERARERETGKGK